MDTTQSSAYKALGLKTGCLLWLFLYNHDYTSSFPNKLSLFVNNWFYIAVHMNHAVKLFMAN